MFLFTRARRNLFYLPKFCHCMHRSLNVIRGCLRFSCRTRWLSVLSAIFLTLLASQELLAQQNRAPFLEPVTRHELVIGEILDLVVRPFDPDGVVPSLNLLEAPSGTTLTDAGNGARRLQWRPDSCLLYTSPSPRDATLSRMPSSA